MRLSAFQKNYSLHDSPITNLSYVPEQGQLILSVEVCDDGQWPLGERGSDPWPVNVVFTGVSHYSLSTHALDFENDEISHARLLPAEKPGKERIEFILLTTSRQGMDQLKTLQIEAENVDWSFS